MDKRHDDILTSRLEEIVTKGCTFVAWNELYLWYGVARLATRTYRDLANRWDEIAAAHDLAHLGKLAFVQTPWNRSSSPGMFLFGSEMPQLVNDYDE
jgi:hypothetical protein